MVKKVSKKSVKKSNESMGKIKDITIKDSQK